MPSRAKLRLAYEVDILLPRSSATLSFPTLIDFLIQHAPYLSTFLHCAGRQEHT